MRGLLFKRDNGWEVVNKEADLKLPLHPSEVANYDWMYQSYTPEEYNREPSDIPFTIVEECTNYDNSHFGKDCSCKTGFVQYAKINYEIEEAPKKRKISEQDIERAAENYYRSPVGNADKFDAFIAGVKWYIEQTKKD